MFTAKILGKIDDGWGKTRVGIFQDDVQIGEYVRNYHGFNLETFFPFCAKDGKWYALYSEHYTCTYIMSLPDCKKIGGEEPVAHGFCPVEYYVPKYKIYKVKGYTEEEMIEKGIPKENWHWVSKDREYKEYLNPGEREEDFNDFEGNWIYDLEKGFVAGCRFGDDCSWKIEHLDLTKIDQGIIARKDSFGYIELPNNLNLKNAIYISEGECVTIAAQLHYRKKDNKIKLLNKENLGEENGKEN